ncbi:VOC family protein [Paenibacillus oenotherae]|uniref:VOC family protein n=1 Tax=Paenibacillus oenotherae TaxID=1435645 RepID=A0ABS7D6L8_9BACL|nr:VOC family protein [Paenibacillus oenotherae]MBW7475481.1 VOC family protein [Paenibacillus oenotherae]
MAKHVSYIMSENAIEQAEFYVQALGGEIQSVMTYGQLPDGAANEEIKDKALHLSLIAGGVAFYMCDSFHPLNQGNAIHQCLEFATEAEAHEAFDKLAEGGTVKHPLTQEFWGSLFGQIEDKYGVLWMITTESETE